ncbi:MAG: hypothetical protein K9G11_03990 [Rickettsiaceae bacterium]|nr:hypothetical protein [Rickettsiaceae bacterium]
MYVEESVVLDCHARIASLAARNDVFLLQLEDVASYLYLRTTYQVVHKPMSQNSL